MGQTKSLSAVKITDKVFWVGAVDWGIRDFHGYSTSRGSTYNAYLIKGDDYILIDTVKAPFMDELMTRISSVVDPGEIRYVISNHSEMDHSGSLPRVLDAIKPEKVFASEMGVKALSAHFHMDREIIPVKNGEKMTLGGVDIAFLETRMLHWPDSMVSYLPQEKLLFSQDGFGMHLASSKRFADEIPRDIMRAEACRYYGNILLPYSGLITKLLKTIADLKLDIQFLCPDHGPIWRKDIDWITGLYSRWALQEPEEKVVVTFDTMWESTFKMAKAITDGILESGVEVKLMPLKSNDRSDVATEVLEAGALLVGTPTINNNMFPTVSDLLTYLKGLKPLNLIGLPFGSFGWSGEAVKQVTEIMNSMKIEMVSDGIRVNYVPDEKALMQCRDLGKSVAGKLKERN